MGNILDREMPYAAIPQLEKMVGKQVDAFFDTIYPAGTFYETNDDNFDPNRKWPGVWEKQESETANKWLRTR